MTRSGERKGNYGEQGREISNEGAHARNEGASKTKGTAPAFMSPPTTGGEKTKASRTTAGEKKLLPTYAQRRGFTGIGSR